MAQTVEDALVVRMEATLRKFERQMEGGRKAAVRAAKGSEQAWKRAGTQITANSNRAATGIGRVMNSMKRGNRFVIQNTANQIGDMAIQLESGTNALRVMGQQIPQVLGGFGAMGGALGVLGPILGTVAALGFPLAAMFFAQGDEAEKSGKKVKTFADRLADAESAIRNADAAAQVASVEGLENLGDMFGEITEEVRDLALELFRIEERAAKLKLGQIIDEVTDGIAKATEAAAGAVDSALSQAGTDEAIEAAAAYREEIERLQASIDARRNAGLVVDQAEINLLNQMRQELAAMEGDFANLGALADDVKLPPELLAQLNQAQAALQAAQEAGDFGAVADQLAVIRDIMAQMGDTFSQDVLDKVTLSEEQARLLAKAIEDGKAAAQGIEEVDLASAIGGGADAAKRMADDLGVALGIAQKLRDLGRGTPDGNVIFDPRDPNYDPVLAALARANQEPERLFENGSSRSSRSTSRGGSAPDQPGLFDAAEQQLTNLNRQIEMIGKTRGEIAELTAKYRLLDEAKQRGLDLDKKQIGTGETLRQEIERQAGAIGDLSQRYEDARDHAAFFEQQQNSVKNGMLDAIVEGENLAGVLADVAKAFARAALEAALFNSGPFASGGGSAGGGLLGGLASGLSGLFGGGVTTQASTAAAGLPSVFNSSGNIALPSFAGGGSTGFGARSGGIDGQGGFLSVLHPNETVTDHTRGGGAARPVVNNITIKAPPGSEVQEDRRQNSSGGEDLTVLIDKAVSGLARDPGSNLSRTLGQNFGIRPTTRGR